MSKGRNLNNLVCATELKIYSKINDAVIIKHIKD